MTSQGQTAVNNYVKQLSVRFLFLLDSRDVIRTRVKCMHVVKEWRKTKQRVKKNLYKQIF